MDFIKDYGPWVGLVVMAAYIIIPKIAGILPEAWQWWTRHRDDLREGEQKLKETETKTEQLERLAAMGSRTFVEDQLTILTSENQTQLNEANEFIRKIVAERLDNVVQVLLLLKDKIDRHPTAYDFREMTQKIEYISNILEHELTSQRPDRGTEKGVRGE